MSEPTGPTGEAAASTGTGSFGSASHVPWHLIPAFEPGETNLTEYSRRLEFLAGIWPPEQAPRAALQCRGAEFQKVVRFKPKQLKVNSLDGIKLIVTTLDGVWGKTVLEDRYSKFKRAIFEIIQKSDESNESYVARHDLVVNAIRILGTKFFHEVQGQQKYYKNKTYDVNHVQKSEEDCHYAEENHYAFNSKHMEVDKVSKHTMAKWFEIALGIVAVDCKSLLNPARGPRGPELAVALPYGSSLLSKGERPPAADHRVPSKSPAFYGIFCSSQFFPFFGVCGWWVNMGQHRPQDGPT